MTLKSALLLTHNGTIPGPDEFLLKKSKEMNLKLPMGGVNVARHHFQMRRNHHTIPEFEDEKEKI